MSRPEWWLSVVAERDIALAIQGATPVKDDPAKAQLNQEDLAFNVLLQVAQYLRQREQIPSALADYLAGAIEYAAKAPRTYDEYRKCSKRVDALLKELNFLKETSGPREVLGLREKRHIVRHLELLKAGKHPHLKSQKALAAEFEVSPKTIQRIWKEHMESSPEFE